MQEIAARLYICFRARANHIEQQVPCPLPELPRGNIPFRVRHGKQSRGNDDENSEVRNARAAQRLLSHTPRGVVGRIRSCGRRYRSVMPLVRRSSTAWSRYRKEQTRRERRLRDGSAPCSKSGAVVEEVAAGRQAGRRVWAHQHRFERCLWSSAERVCKSLWLARLRIGTLRGLFGAHMLRK